MLLGGGGQRRRLEHMVRLQQQNIKLVVFSSITTLNIQTTADRELPCTADTLKSDLQMHIYCLFSCVASAVKAGHCAQFIKHSLFWLFNGRLKGRFVQRWDRMCLFSVYLVGSGAAAAAAAAPSSGLVLPDME